MKVLVLAASILAVTAQGAFAYPIAPVFGTEDVNLGTLCAVRDVTVLAASPEDCTKVGGKATHKVVKDIEEIK